MVCNQKINCMMVRGLLDMRLVSGRGFWELVERRKQSFGARFRKGINSQGIIFHKVKELLWTTYELS